VATASLTQRPFGVNLITMHPQLMDLIDVCLAHGVGHVVLAGGIPPAAAIVRIRDGGARAVCFAPALVLAKKLVRSGAEAIVIEGSEAGGHIGPVSAAVLAQEVLPHMTEVPVFVAGGIGRGEAILSYLEMGAAGVQLGTRFVCAHESIAHPNFKRAFVRASARDAMPSVQLDARFPVIPVRALANPATERFAAIQRAVIERFSRGELSQKDAQLEIEHFWAGALRRAVIDGDVENGSLMAGQSVGLVSREQSTVEILDELVEQALAAIEARRWGDKPPAGMARPGAAGGRAEGR
jgi:enoyl-[acyl-carrier protein] reductase II